MVRTLVKSGADPDAKTNDGKTALMAASFTDPLKWFDCCWKSAPVQILRTMKVFTPLMHASVKGHFDVAKLLLEKGRMSMP